MAQESPRQFGEDHRFELLVDAVGDYAIYMLDLGGFVTSWNSGAERIKGYRRSEILGQHFSRFFQAEDQRNKLPERILSEAREKGRHEAEGWRVRKDGQRFWANAIVQTLHDENGTHIGFAKITRDMTDKVAAQDALLESERRFRLLVEGVVDYAIYMLDASGIVLNWNPGAERMKGYTADEIVGQHFSKFYTKEERAKGVPGRVLATAAAEGKFEAEGWRLRKDGSRFWASVVIDAIRNKEGELEGFAKVTRDITERRSAQDAMRESERQFRLLVNNVTDYALYMLDPNGIVSSWNAGAQRIKGYTADEIIGHHFSRFYTERERSAGAPARALYTAIQEGRYEADAWRVRKDGTQFWANVVIDPIRDERGELVGFAKITRDITERRETQLALQEAETRRAQSQKMDALGQLTGGVAHDFNNLLTIIGGQVPKLKKIVTQNKNGEQAVSAIEVAVQRGASLTRQLLSFSRRQTYQPIVVDLGRLIDDMRGMLTSFISGTLNISTVLPPDIWTAKVDVSELELALVNIIINARDAMPGGGIITIALENVTLKAADTPAKLVGDFIAIRIADTGQGIAPDILPRVFDPFFTTKQVDKGTGLGLSQVHGFSHQSGGTATIDSEFGKGTTVSIYLPRSLEALGTSEPEPTGEVRGEGKVLVVEDNPDVAEVTVSMLRDVGYEVVVARSADEALAKVEAGDFDLVVSDIVMSGSMDGISLARQLTDDQPGLPVLLVTGYSHKATEIGSEFPILRKPFQVSELSRLSARLIAAAKQSPSRNIVRLRRKKPPRES